MATLNAEMTSINADYTLDGTLDELEPLLGAKRKGSTPRPPELTNPEPKTDTVARDIIATRPATSLGELENRDFSIFQMPTSDAAPFRPVSEETTRLRDSGLSSLRGSGLSSPQDQPVVVSMEDIEDMRKEVADLKEKVASAKTTTKTSKFWTYSFRAVSTALVAFQSFQLYKIGSEYASCTDSCEYKGEEIGYYTASFLIGAINLGMNLFPSKTKVTFD